MRQGELIKRVLKGENMRKNGKSIVAVFSSFLICKFRKSFFPFFRTAIRSVSLCSAITVDFFFVILTDTTKPAQSGPERSEGRSRGWRRRRWYRKSRSSSGNVRRYLHGRSGTDCCRRESAPMTTYQA